MSALSTPSGLAVADLPGPAGRGARYRTAVGVWLLTAAGLVLSMAVIGAITRLTESGLSMVEWKPLIGMLPPLSEAEWRRVFDLYRATPEFRLHHLWMSLADFKHIFFWEWFHRLWGQLVGFGFALPLVWFWAKGALDQPLLRRLGGVLLLGGLQGGVGWFMVKSGLVDRPSVSHYRLAMHLGMAVLIMGLLAWIGMSVLAEARGLRRPVVVLTPGQPAAGADLRGHVRAALALAVITIAWGAFVAGLHAGQAYNTFPLMGETWMPEEVWMLDPLWFNLVENPAGVQFAHRWLAIATCLVCLALGWRAWTLTLPGRARAAALAVAVMSCVQVGLGVATLLLFVPVWLGSLHQAGGLTLFLLLVWTLHELRVCR